MNNITKGESVFLDTTFLASFSIAEHKDLPKAQKLLALLLINECKMYTSMLCIHELLGVIKYVHNSKYGNYPTIRKANKILKHFYIKILFNEINFSYQQIFKKLQESISNLQQSGYINLVSFRPIHLSEALECIKNNDSKPGDSFHFSVAKNLGIKTVVTGNIKDFKRMDLKTIWF